MIMTSNRIFTEIIKNLKSSEYLKIFLYFIAYLDQEKISNNKISKN
tara:strand:- start:2727 stop:2864 length:138 start_codon:yes stop_codon:yes gene_type:complete